MRRIFIDMDGVLAKFEEASLEEMTSPGFFRSRKPVDSVISMVKALERYKNLDIYVLSSYLLPMSKEEKIEWNKEYTQIPEEKQIYVPYGSSKADSLNRVGGIHTDDVLVDDFTPNLKDWTGVGVKLYNGINGKHGTWDGFSIHSNMKPGIMACQLKSIIDATEHLLTKNLDKNSDRINRRAHGR